MLQQAILKPDKAISSLPVVEYSELLTASPCMTVSRFNLNASTIRNTGLPHQNDYSSSLFPSTELVQQQSVMSVNTHAPSKRSFIQDSRRGESAEDVGWEEPTRCIKRREVSPARESSSNRYVSVAATANQHHQLQSGGSDLTTEQSAVCMAADESNSTRSTSSLNEDGCLLKLHSIVPLAESGYGDLQVDADDEDYSSKHAPCVGIAVRASYNLHSSHATCPSHLHSPTASMGVDWLSTRSHEACVKYIASLHDDTARLDDAEETNTDWLELRLGQNGECADGVPNKSRSTSPCTLQLLPEKPDCAGMKEREKDGELRLCFDEQHEDGKMVSSLGDRPLQGQAVVRAQGRAPLMRVQNHVKQAAKLTENQQHFYSNLMQMPHSEGTVGQFIASRGWLPAQHNASAAMDRSCSYGESTLDHPSHVQDYPPLHVQDTSFQCSQGIRHPLLLQDEAMLQCRDASSLHALHRTISLKSTAPCSIVNEGLLQAGSPIPTRSSSSLPDFLHLNWDNILTSSTSASSPPSAPVTLLQRVPTAPTSFRDLIASSFVKEPLSMINGCSSNVAMTAAVGNNVERMHASNYMELCGSKSLSDWLSQAVSATSFSGMNQKQQPIGVENNFEEADNHYHLQDRSYNNVNHNKNIELPTGILLQKAVEYAAAGKVNKTRVRQRLRLNSDSGRGISPGFWFALQPASKSATSARHLEADTEFGDGGVAENHVQSKRSYIRLKNGNVPLSVVKKFLIAKLGLSQESQVGFSCRGKLLEECNYLARIHDDIWIQPNFLQKQALTFKSTTPSTLPIDNVMTLTYEILQ